MLPSTEGMTVVLDLSCGRRQALVHRARQNLEVVVRIALNRLDQPVVAVVVDSGPLVLVLCISSAATGRDVLYVLPRCR